MKWLKYWRKQYTSVHALVDALCLDYHLDYKARSNLKDALFKLVKAGCPISAVEDAIRDIFDNVCSQEE